MHESIKIPRPNKVKFVMPGIQLKMTPVTSSRKIENIMMKIINRNQPRTFTGVRIGRQGFKTVL